MSEIEKMYENTGIKPTKNWQSCLDCKLKTEIRYDEWGEEYLTCNRLERPENCPDAKEYYPIFTAEKQIELIEWLIRKYKTISIEHKLNLFYINITDIYTGMVHIEFDETIAGLINNIWQFLTEEEKQQVKEILK